MKNVILQFCDKQEIREYLRLPWMLEDKIAATNGHILFLGNPDVVKYEGELYSGDKKPRLEEILESIGAYGPLDVSVIDSALSKETPKKYYTYEAEPCNACDGTGDCQCECGDDHDCGKCKGEGSVRISNEPIGFTYETMKTKFFHVLIDWKYLNTVKEVIEEFPGEWQIALKKELDPVGFTNGDIQVIVMPMRA